MRENNFVQLLHRVCEVLLFVIVRRSISLDSWTPEQLKLMSFGGNGRARTFFKQHGWDDGGRIESKYTSRAAELYRQLLAKEVAKAAATAPSPTSPPARVSSFSNGFGGSESGTDFFDSIQQPVSAPPPPPAPAPTSAPATILPASRPAVGTVTKKGPTLGAKKLVGGKPGGGLGVKKLTVKVCSFSSPNLLDVLERIEWRIRLETLDWSVSNIHLKEPHNLMAFLCIAAK